MQATYRAKVPDSGIYPLLDLRITHIYIRQTYDVKR